jgi:hypothetical protein
MAHPARVDAQSRRAPSETYWGLVVSAVGLSGDDTFPSDNNNVAPRVALAWDPRNDKKTSVHAAYGLFHTT